MNEETIKIWVRTKILRQTKVSDKEKIKSLIKSAEMNAKAVKAIELKEDNSTLIFREIYESIRQLGEAKWLITGYEPQNHEISLESLKELDIQEKIKLNFLDRFRQIRNDANYNGFIVSILQSKEILEFWNKCGEEIISKIKENL